MIQATIYNPHGELLYTMEQPKPIGGLDGRIMAVFSRTWFYGHKPMSGTFEIEEGSTTRLYAFEVLETAPLDVRLTLMKRSRRV